MPKEENIYLVEADPGWPDKFKAEKDLVEQTLGDWIDGGIHHVGSTAVLGLTAKPIIDIMVGVGNLAKSREAIPLLEEVGYCYFPYRPEIMHWFCKPSPAHREFHLYLMEPGTSDWWARLAFRDYLRNHPEVAAEYVALKEALARQYSRDREAYTEAKSEFIRAVLNRAPENI
jgi:GrpB-like predicted nucleotidyltransferase (UPF0157 family)